MIKGHRVDRSRYILPELEVTEFAMSHSPRHAIEDPNDLGELGDSFSIGTDMLGEDDDFSF